MTVHARLRHTRRRLLLAAALRALGVGLPCGALAQVVTLALTRGRTEAATTSLVVALAVAWGCSESEVIRKAIRMRLADLFERFHWDDDARSPASREER